MQLPYVSANLLMERWKVYPLDIYVLIITSDFPAYQLTGSKDITTFIPPSEDNVYAEKLVEELLFKPEDVVDIENRYDLGPLNTDKKSKDKKKTSPEIINMADDAGQEVERLYTAIKKIGFSGREQATAEEYKDAVTKFYRENKSEFKLIKESYLSDWSLYSFRDGHQKGDFIGKLLQKVANENNYDIDNYQKLYKIYKSTK
jgi:hypothetical protein